MPQEDDDRAFFQAQIESRLDGLYGAALRLTRNPADAEDLVAETAAKAWKALPSLQDRQSFPKWIHRILVHQFVSERRHLRAERESTATLPDGQEDFSLFERLHQPFLLWWGNPEQAFVNRLLRHDLEKALDALPDCFRSVVILVEVQGFTYSEVADLLDIPLGTVRSRLNRGRSLLQQALWEQAREAGLVPEPSSNTSTDSAPVRPGDIRHG